MLLGVKVLYLLNAVNFMGFKKFLFIFMFSLSETFRTNLDYASYSNIQEVTKFSILGDKSILYKLSSVPVRICSTNKDIQYL